ncbi:tetratricopeptide repeat protein [Roseovarius sp. CAU 1744]|uniref:tetratricopeptide repeat protein n=1 Tax=Roseovarius sp. CAU 1744 TaxID=3140368 RepID=UPI00325B7D7A
MRHSRQLLLCLCLCLTVPGVAWAFVFVFGTAPVGPSGVQMQSDTPIFNSSSALRIKTGVDVVAVAKSPDDEITVYGEKVAALRKPNHPPFVIVHALRWDNGTYRVEPLPGAGDIESLAPFFRLPSSNIFWGAPFSIHKTPDDKIYVAQVERKKDDKRFYQYFYLRFGNGRLYYDESAGDFDPEPGQFAGHDVSVEKGKVIVRDAKGLFAALDAQAEAQKHQNIKTVHLDYASGFGGFLVESDLNTARRASLSALCLYLAESPGDPGRERGRKDHSVPFAVLNPDHAVPVCEAALAAGQAAPSVRFSATRALTAKANRTNDVALTERVRTMLEGLAAEGFAPAMLNLAFRHFGGPGITPDPAAAKRDLEKLAQAGNAQAAYWLGRAIRLNWVKGTQEEARRYLQQAIIGRVIEGYGDLGLLLQASDSEDDRTRAQTLFIQGAEEGDAESMFQIGLILRKEKLYNGAIKRIDEAAKRGHLEALYFQGFMRMAGQGVTKNASSAQRSFEHAARHNHVGAKMYLGHLLCRNPKEDNLKERHTRGKALLEEAKAAGYDRAETYLTDCKV